MSPPRLGLAARLTLLTVALLVIAQLINAVLLTMVEQRLRTQQAEAVLIERTVQATRFLVLSGRDGRYLGRRRAFRVEGEPPSSGRTIPYAQTRLEQALGEAGLGGRDHRFLRAEGPRRPRNIAAVEVQPDRWLTVTLPAPRAIGLPWRLLLLQTFVLLAVLILPAIWIGRQVARPLRQLTHAADSFLRGGRGPALPDSGPPDIKALRDAYSALEGRVLGAIEERTVMLGALGHDLRTPLASLRIRVEEVQDQELREGMIGSIETLAVTLDDILAFSRGASTPATVKVRSDALIQSILSDYEGRPVRPDVIEAVTLFCAPHSVERALRNLIDNALRYAGDAEVSVVAETAAVRFSVVDRGPGLKAQEVEELQKPFARGEGSRNRSKGGIGLGLSISKAIAQAHHGTLELKNREGGGLCADLILPVQQRVDA